MKPLISKFGLGVFLAVATLFAALPTNAFAADPNQNKINKYTRDLKNLPNRAAPTSRITSLVKKLVQLQPGKTSQYYAIGLRKVGLPGAAGKAYADRLNREVQKVLGRTDLPQKEQNAMVRRLNKIERLFVPPAETPTPTPVSATAMLRAAPGLLFAHGI
jgi:hypothetical protein